MADDLFKAIQANDAKALQAVLAAGATAHLNEPNANGELPLHAAMKAKNLGIVQALLEAGANVNQPSEERGTTKGYTAAHFAARNGDVDAIELLHKHKGDFNRHANDGWAPIHTACFAGKSNTTRRLVELGADVNSKNEHGMTPLVFASNHGRVSDVRFLLQKGGDVKFVDANGDTLMHHALHFRLQEMFEGEYDMPECQLDVAVCLAVNGAPVEAKNLQGKPSFEWMTECDMPALADVLKVLSHNSGTIIKAGGADLNYVSILSAPAQVFQALGMPPSHAKDLEKSVRAFDEQRLAEKKRREESRPAGGCPVMKGGRKKKGTAAAAAGGDEGQAADAAAGAPPAGHPPVDMADVPEESDPSNGQCPFFQKRAQQAANSAAPATVAPEAAPATSSSPPAPQQPQAVAAAPGAAATAPGEASKAGGAPSLSWETLYENRVVILLMLVSFFFGSWVESKFGASSARFAVPVQ